MNTSSSTISYSPTLPQLLEAIEGYFDCTLTESEERTLYIWLSATTYNHPAIDEARAVMGITHLKYTATYDKKSSDVGSRSKSFLIPLYSAVAATVAVLLLVVTLLHSPKTESTCIAYAGGKKIVDENEVLALIHSQMIDFDTQSQTQSVEFICQLSDLPPVMEGSDEISDLFL